LTLAQEKPAAESIDARLLGGRCDSSQSSVKGLIVLSSCLTRAYDGQSDLRFAGTGLLKFYANNEMGVGLGLRSMQERLQNLGGRLVFHWDKYRTLLAASFTNFAIRQNEKA